MKSSNDTRACRLSRRSFLRWSVVPVAFAATGLVACQTTTSPTPSPAPSTPKPAQPSAPTPASASGAQPATPAAAKPTGKQATIRFSIWFGPADIEAWKNTIAEFKQVQPTITVEFEPLAWQQYWQKLNTQLAAGDVQEVTGMHVGLVYDYARKKQLLNLTDLMKRDNINVGDFFAPLLEEGRWPKNRGVDALYMLPWRFVGSAFVANKDLLKKAGIDVPKEGWTWTNWREWAKQLRNEKDGIWGSGVPSGQIHQPYFMQAGAYGPLTEDLSKSNFLDPGVKEAVQFFADMILKDRTAPKPEELPQGQDLFLSGKIALYPSASWNLPAWRKAEFDWDVIPQPVYKAKGAYAGPDGIAIPTASKEQDAAWEWVKFSTHDRRAQRILGATGIPVIKEFALSSEYIDSEAKKKPASYRIVVEELQNGRGFGFNSKWFEWTREVNQIFPQIYNGKLSVDEGLKMMDQKVNEILSRPD